MGTVYFYFRLYPLCLLGRVYSPPIFHPPVLFCGRVYLWVHFISPAIFHLLCLFGQSIPMGTIPLSSHFSSPVSFWIEYTYGYNSFLLPFLISFTILGRVYMWVQVIFLPFLIHRTFLGRVYLWVKFISTLIYFPCAFLVRVYLKIQFISSPILNPLYRFW